MSEQKAATVSPRNSQASRNPAPAQEESMVVRLSRLDKMLELAGEVIIVSSNLNTLSHQINEGREITKELAEDAKDLAITSSRISSDLHSLVTDVRTVDMGDLFARFRRLARDTSRRLGKPIRFEVEGEEICIDKKISEKIHDPIAHQIRNAIAHGIEDENTRKGRGKDPVGHVKVRVRNLDNSTVIDVIDDGGGIDSEGVREKIVQMGLADRKAADALSDDALFDYLFLPGFSTAKRTSGTSGRGVGLDVVRNVMNEVNGETRIESREGEGTAFSFILPLVTAVNIADALLVRAGSTTFAFPISSVLASMSVPLSGVTTTTGKGRSIIYLGNILPLFDLLEVFGEGPIEVEGDQLRVIIIEDKKRRVAYIVSDFLNPQKIVISEFESGMRVAGLTGTATLSGRKMGMVVNMPKLLDQTFGVDREVEINASIAAEALGERGFAESGGDGGVVLEKEERSAEETPSRDADYAERTLGESDSVFLQEVESMLSRLNRELLTLDEKRDSETADSVFRLAHSIKGNLTMFGADEPASITHQMETILERARKGALELKDDSFDILFDGSAYLEEAVGAFLHGREPAAPPEKLVEGINRFKERERDTARKDASPDLDSSQIQLDATGEFYLSSRRREGAPLTQCFIEFDLGDQPRFLVAYLILRRIQRVADVLGSLPSMNDIEAGLCQNGIAVLIAPRDPKPDPTEGLSENLKRYYGVTRFDAAPFA